MDDFLRNIVEIRGIQAPESCAQFFNERFPGAINSEWFKNEQNFEVHFHLDEIEYIALMDPEGMLLRYKMYLDKELLPSKIKFKLEKDWEIMNSILINNGNSIKYEIIVRNENLTRYLLMVDYLGEIHQKSRL